MTLEGTLAVTVEPTAGESPTVEFAFTVRNEGSEPVEINFSDSGKTEFVVRDEKREIWRFTDGRMFAQLLSTDRLEAGETTTYEGEWENPRPGEYTAVAELRARETDCEARSEFTVSS
ncbi:hypothetical protein D8Y22_13355 [Salinadaptatus halalkaliphilus]|uniref:Intracellular proteinase inhibitor BsuPI domain-containing protein n=1 Tax=Salinadaptatus halalkaliphilus TaxID=2419781 RepID=A0A4S3TM99_9EURY|nr:BsuPI-related putative proteinase inhibitor [Salinadaptatus halalkaliphilus]THE64393.1 hypothetical protein D8Y22_13355 [Salinadaptatus halalkaliphilus]